MKHYCTDETATVVNDHWICNCPGSPFVVINGRPTAKLEPRRTPPSVMLAGALQALVSLKDYKDEQGKDEFYQQTQPEAWAAARTALERYYCK